MTTDPLDRIAEALERMAPAPLAAPDFEAADAFVWHVDPDRLEPVPNVSRIAIDLLIGVDRSRNTLLENTIQFAKGLPANNALLWGARGMGKSSLVKAVHAEVNRQGHPIKIVEMQRDQPSARQIVWKKIEKLGGKPEIRVLDRGYPFVTENSNIILDCDFGIIKNPKILQQRLLNIAGIIEVGIFTRKPDIIYKAKENGKFDVLT